MSTDSNGRSCQRLINEIHTGKALARTDLES